MIYNENTYYIGYHRNVRAYGAIPALVFDTICGLVNDPENMTGEISNTTLCELLGITPQGLRKIIQQLISIGWITKSSTAGRGNKTTYTITEKGKRDCPLCDPEKGKRGFQKRETRFPKKGNNVSPLNTELNKELKESGGVSRDAQSPTLSDTTPLNFETMKDFNEFWELYPGDPDWSSEKENCERVWYTMQQSWRDNLVQQLKNGLRWRKRENDNPYWYLKNYNGETAHAELPIMRQGTSAFSKWINSAVKEGRRVCVMLMGEGDASKCVYCLETDRAVCEQNGLRFVRYY